MKWKESGYQEKFEALNPWLLEIIDSVKRDLKQDHLKIDPAFCKRYFFGKNPAQLTAQELTPAYAKDIAEGNVGLGEFIASRWIFKNTDVYGFFEDRLNSLTPDFDKIDELPVELSENLLAEALKTFGPKRVYIFSLINAVAFPDEIYERLRKGAENEKQERQEIEEMLSIEKLKLRHQREIAAITDKYEKKLQGFQKKYQNDVAVLKKQVSTLQKKFAESA